MVDPSASHGSVEPELSSDAGSRIGQVVGDRYEVVRVLGEGGMGVVYEVRHRAIRRRFAMKFLRMDVASRRSVVNRFRREAETAADLQTENVVAVLDFGTCDDGSPYLVMEYLEGEDVARLLQRAGPLPVHRALEIIAQVCRGLRVAHRRGIVHRDLKPANLFVHNDPDRGEVVKILDFGIAKLVCSVQAETKTQSGLTLGTPFYMSPEQARGDSGIDERTDVYALGVILYELLTGAKPHPGNNATAVLFHLLKQSPLRIESLRPGLPPGLGDVVHRAFAFEAAERFPSVDALEAALQPFRERTVSEDRPAIGTMTPPSRPSAKSIRGSWFVLVLAVPACVIAASLAAAAFPKGDRPAAATQVEASPPKPSAEPGADSDAGRPEILTEPAGPPPPVAPSASPPVVEKSPSRHDTPGPASSSVRAATSPAPRPAQRVRRDYLYEP